MASCNQNALLTGTLSAMLGDGSRLRQTESVLNPCPAVLGQAPWPQHLQQAGYCILTGEFFHLLSEGSGKSCVPLEAFCKHAGTTAQPARSLAPLEVAA